MTQAPAAGLHGGITALRDDKTEALADLIRERARAPILSLLVVGCGSGVEAAILARKLGARVVGVDLDTAFDADAAAAVDLRRGDATCLEFQNGSFDFVFSYHALEHIPAHGKAIEEMARVLSVGGAYCVGTPNRLRLIGYLGSKDAKNWREKLAWNLADWKARLQGRFRNECGAHAGFSSRELQAWLVRAFVHTEEITLPYYRRIYPGYAFWLSLLGKLGLGPLVFPSVYFMGRK